MDSKSMKIGGICCPHCDAKIKHAISRVSGVSEVNFDNSENTAHVSGNFDASAVENAVKNLGYSILN